MFIIFSNISVVIKQYLGTMSRLVTLNRNKYSSFHYLFLTGSISGSCHPLIVQRIKPPKHD